MTQPALILLLVALVAANLPFLSERILFVRRPASGRKAFGWRFLEWALLYGVVGLLAWLAEGRLGTPHPQGWEFYAVTVCLFLVFAYPGFVLRYLYRRRAAAPAH